MAAAVAADAWPPRAAATILGFFPMSLTVAAGVWTLCGAPTRRTMLVRRLGALTIQAVLMECASALMSWTFPAISSRMSWTSAMALARQHRRVAIMLPPLLMHSSSAKLMPTLAQMLAGNRNLLSSVPLQNLPWARSAP